MMSTNMKNSIVNYGITGDIDISVNEKNANSDIDYEKFSELLGNVIVESNDKEDRKYAAQAKEYLDKNDKKGLRKFLSDNYGAFATGTLATTAGGLLLKIIQNFLE